MILPAILLGALLLALVDGAALWLAVRLFQREIMQTRWRSMDSEAGTGAIIMLAVSTRSLHQSVSSSKELSGGRSSGRVEP